MAATRKPTSRVTKKQAAQKVVSAARLKKAEAEAAALEVTSAEDWKAAVKAREQARQRKLKLPSGFVCLVTNPGLEVFVLEGMIPNSLLAIVQAAVREGKGLTPKDTQALATDMDALRDMMRLMDLVVLRCVLLPQIEPLPDGGETKDPDLFYIDEVDMEDKQFIFQWAVGGTADLEKFREQQDAAVADLPTREALEEATE